MDLTAGGAPNTLKGLFPAYPKKVELARRNGREWYVGALTNWDARDIEADLSFLGAGQFQAVIFRDGVNAHRAGVDYAREERAVAAADRLRIHLAPGGAWVARIMTR
jgi:alpha-glucosidase